MPIELKRLDEIFVIDIIDGTNLTYGIFTKPAYSMKYEAHDIRLTPAKQDRMHEGLTGHD